MKLGVARGLPRDLYVAAGARAAAILGNAVAVTVLMLDLHDRGAGAWSVAGLLAAGALPTVLLAPLVGSVVDRFDSRALIVASSLWQSAACVVLAFVGHPQVVLLLVVLSACGTAVINPLYLALTSAMVPAGRLAAANSVQQGAVTVAMMAGPAVGGLLTGVTGGVRVPLLIDGVIFGVVAGVSLLIGTRRRPAPEGPEPNARAGITMLFTDPALAAVVTLAAVLPVVVHVIYVAQVFLVRDALGASAPVFGLLQATHMTGLLIGAVWAGRLDTERRILLAAPLAAAVMSTAIALIGLVPSLPAVFALYVVAGVSMSMVSVSMGTMLLLRIPEPVVGRVMAGFTAIHRTAGLIAYGLGGLAVGLVRPEAVYLFAGTAALVIVLVLTPGFRRARALDQPVGHVEIECAMKSEPAPSPVFPRRPHYP
ncbi:MFS transporter [Saccharothrix stipae]